MPKPLASGAASDREPALPMSPAAAPANAPANAPGVEPARSSSAGCDSGARVVHAPGGVFLTAPTVKTAMNPILAASEFGEGFVQDATYMRPNNYKLAAMYVPYVVIELQRRVELNDALGFLHFCFGLDTGLFREFTHHRTMRTHKYIRHITTIDSGLEQMPTDIHWKGLCTLLSIISTHAVSIALGGQCIDDWVVVVTTLSRMNDELAVLVADELCTALDRGLSWRSMSAGR